MSNARNPWGCLFSIAIAVPWAWTGAGLGADPSVCLTGVSGCEFKGGTVELSIRLGAGDASIIGAQFEISYDPQALTPLRILPGAFCDPASPFDLAIHEEHDPDNGRLFYAVGVNPFTGGVGTSGPATVACATFLARSVSQSNVCVLFGEAPHVTCLSDDTGHVVNFDNSLECPTGVPGAASCQQVNVTQECHCLVDADCSGLDDACRVGVCDSTTQLCRIDRRNEGLPCDDHNSCTSNDLCVSSNCVGSGCTNPSLCLPEQCTPRGSLTVIPVMLGAGDPTITGAQFSLQWAADGLHLVSIQPGSTCDLNSPFEVEVQSFIDWDNHQLFYAVSVPTGHPGTQGPSTLACLLFQVEDQQAAEACLIHGLNPFLTKLVDDRGQLVNFFNGEDCPADPDAHTGPLIHCVVPVQCDIPTASFWGLMVLSLGLLIGAKLRFGRTPQAA